MFTFMGEHFKQTLGNNYKHPHACFEHIHDSTIIIRTFSFIFFIYKTQISLFIDPFTNVPSISSLTPFI